MLYDYKKLYPEMIGIIICIALGMLSGFLSHASDSAWYMSLQKPCYNPPSWVFAPVWTVLYGMIGIVMGRLWKQRCEHQGLMQLFIMQFVCNLAWSPLFFYAHRIDLACVDICLLWIFLMIFMIYAYQEKSVWILCVPYFAWVSFALILNVSLLMLNSY